MRRELPHLRAIVQYSGELDQVRPPVLYTCTVHLYTMHQEARGEPGVMTWAQLMLLGRAQVDTELDTRLGDIAANQCAALCYTSGTTGNPKVII